MQKVMGADGSVIRAFAKLPRLASLSKCQKMHFQWIRPTADVVGVSVEVMRKSKTLALP